MRNTSLIAAIVGMLAGGGGPPPTVKRQPDMSAGPLPPSRPKSRSASLMPPLFSGHAFHPPMPTHRKSSQRAAKRLRNLKKHRAHLKAQHRRKTRTFV